MQILAVSPRVSIEFTHSAELRNQSLEFFLPATLVNIGCPNQGGVAIHMDFARVGLWGYDELVATFDVPPVNCCQ
jgi:hypothetical protein